MLLHHSFKISFNFVALSLFTVFSFLSVSSFTLRRHLFKADMTSFRVLRNKIQVLREQLSIISRMYLYLSRDIESLS